MIGDLPIDTRPQAARVDRLVSYAKYLIPKKLHNVTTATLEVLETGYILEFIEDASFAASEGDPRLNRGRTTSPLTKYAYQINSHSLIFRMQTFFVYMLTNKYNNVLYTGMTNDLVRRTFEHKSKSAKGFTAKYNCEKLVWFEEHTDSDEAFTRERLIKRWPREWKNKLVEAENPEWLDLAADW